jgi:FkbM family methyltransferase
MIRNAIGKLDRALKYYGIYTAVFGRARGNWLCATSLCRPKMIGRRVTVVLPGTDIPVIVRLRTSDIQVFHEIFFNHEYEWGFSSAPQVIIDAGGYIGLSAAFFTGKYPHATIITVEPDEENFALLRLNTARFPNVHAIRAAVWRDSGMISVTDPGNGPWGLQVAEVDNTVASDKGLVRAITIDEIIKEFNLERVDLLKVDVEGSETEIFATASTWISSIDAICIELHDRFKAKCSRSFYRAVDEFPIEMRRSEDVLVARADCRLVSTSLDHG